MSAVRWIAPFSVVLLTVYFFVLAPQNDELQEQREMILRLKEQYLNKKKVAVNLDLYRAQLREVDTMFGQVLHAVPSRFHRDFTEVLEPASRRNVRVEDLRPERAETVREFYAELGVYLKVSGRFHDLGRFTADLTGAAGSVLLQDLSLDAGPAAGRVTMTATMRVFRYLSDEEIAAERKRARATKGKKG